VERVVTGQQAWQEAVFLDAAFQRPAQGGPLPNDTPYGLVDSVLTADLARGMRVARRLRAGMVHVNDATPQDEALAPFGGMGASGLGGRSGGDANLEEFTQRRWLTVAPGPVHYPY